MTINKEYSVVNATFGWKISTRPRTCLLHDECYLLEQTKRELFTKPLFVNITNYKRGVFLKYTIPIRLDVKKISHVCIKLKHGSAIKITFYLTKILSIKTY